MANATAHTTSPPTKSACREFAVSHTHAGRPETYSRCSHMTGYTLCSPANLAVVQAGTSLHGNRILSRTAGRRTSGSRPSPNEPRCIRCDARSGWRSIKSCKLRLIGLIGPNRLCPLPTLPIPLMEDILSYRLTEWEHSLMKRTNVVSLIPQLG